MANSNIYKKLELVRTAIKKEEFNNFPELLEVVNKKLKSYKLLPLYCFYNDIATLSIVDMDEITTVLKFQVPVNLVDMKNVKEYLYKMAFDIEGVENITAKQYVTLCGRIKELGVKEKEIIDRYHIKSLADMTPDIYKRCMVALDKTSNK